MAKIKFGSEEENVVTREEFPVSKALDILKDEIIAVIGYGVQGPAQAMNMRDNGFKVIIGQAPEFKSDWDKAIKDGWIPGETLFPVVEAVKKATIIQFLVSDAAQRLLWPSIKPCLNEGDALYFSHGFSITFKEQTDVIPPANIDVSWLHQKDRVQVCVPTSWQERVLIQVMQYFRIIPAGLWIVRWRLVSLLDPATCFLPPSKMKYIPTLPANAAS